MSDPRGGDGRADDGGAAGQQAGQQASYPAGAPAAAVDVAQVAERVYRLLLDDVRLEQARGGTRGTGRAGHRGAR